MILQNCVLTYFAIPGRGEAARLALAIGSTSFADQRIPFPEWGALKPTTTWGSLPMLTLADGTRIAQQRAILRFIGRETGLYPMDDAIRCAKMDEIMDATEELSPKTNAIGQGLPQEEKEAARKAAFDKGGAVHSFLGKIDAYIVANGSDGHVVGKNFSVADIFVYTTCSNLVSGLFDGVPANALDGFANIQACRKMVRNHPAVVKYYENSKADMPAAYGLIE